jgi:hypothetical protein
MKQTILHISNAHSSFDDRIFYKELVSLSSQYACYLIAGGNKKGLLTTMGSDMVPTGIYNDVHITPFPVKYHVNIIVRAFRKLFPAVYRAIYNFVCVKRLIAICRRNTIKPVIIHFHDLGLADVAKRIKEYFNAKLIFDCHEFYFGYPLANGLNYLNLLRASKSLIALKNAVRNSDGVISVSKNMDNIISLMMKNDNHIVVYNSSVQPPATEKRELKDKVVLVHEGQCNSIGD